MLKDIGLFHLLLQQPSPQTPAAREDKIMSFIVLEEDIQSMFEAISRVGKDVWSHIEVKAEFIVFTEESPYFRWLVPKVRQP